MAEPLIRDLLGLVGPEGVVTSPGVRVAYECDGYTLERAVPDLVVLPRTVEEVVAVIARLHAAGRSIVPRGAGTSLAGGCLARGGAVVVALTRLREIEQLDPGNRQALVQAGVANAAISRAAAPHGLAYAPDPSSQLVSTLGGNIANNSGGPHTLKAGVTVNHVLALELVTPDGARRWIGSRAPAAGGPDLTGLVVGSEGTFGIVTRAWVRLVPVPPAVRTLLVHFDGMDAAARAVSRIVAGGIVPAAVEMMDRPVLEALAAAFGMTFPPESEAVLLIEVDGLEAGLEDEAQRVEAAVRLEGALSVDRARTERERTDLWRARKQAFGALGKLARNFCTQDGVVPRTRLPEMLARVRDAGARHRIRVANVFHAGDGNLHPVLLYDERDADQVERVLAASVEILEGCLELGGSLTGEHGIGIEKRALMSRAFTPDSLKYMESIRAAFDPERRANPDKLLPAGAGCPDETALALGRVRPGRQVPQ